MASTHETDQTIHQTDTTEHVDRDADHYREQLQVTVTALQACDAAIKLANDRSSMASATARATPRGSPTPPTRSERSWRSRPTGPARGKQATSKRSTTSSATSSPS